MPDHRPEFWSLGSTSIQAVGDAVVGPRTLTDKLQYGEWPEPGWSD